MKCPKCKEQEIVTDYHYDDIYIHDQDGIQRKIEETGYCEVHGIVTYDGVFMGDLAK